MRSEPLEARHLLADVSPPAILQWFESTYGTIEDRLPDVFAAGYGSVYTPPPGRADSGNFSVGYDVYDRFDLGKPGTPTLYGTETGLKTLVNASHRAGLDYYLDFVINHNGFSDLGTDDGQGHSFYEAGGYPGFNITLPQDVDGDFHSAFDSGDLNGRLAGLIDIDHSTNYQMIRSPVDPADSRNIRPGTEPLYGRIANLPDTNNRLFYPDRNLQPIMVFDPITGEQNIAVYPFNNNSPLSGDATPENAMGYLMRNAQWLVQAVGVDGFRIDAAKHVERFALDYFDRAVYRSSQRNLLDGSRRNVFSFQEVFDGSKAVLQNYVKDTITPNDPGRIGGNRDVLDFSLFFSLKQNLSSNGLQNDWRQLADAALDLNDDGQHNGSQGVMFVASHDENGPDLSNVAHAYTLMHPGNALVYFNGKQFGDNRDFPRDGRGDALGGLFGNGLKKLVEIRNTHGRGNYIERWREKELFAFERDRSAIVLLSNRTDAGFDSRTIQTNFPPGTKLIELTGNASSSHVDPFDDIPSLVEVQSDGRINVRFVRNRAADGDFTGNGYLIYGLAGPQGTLSLSNVSSTLAAGTPTAGTNGTTRLTPLDVITGNTFDVSLQTAPVNLLGSIRDAPADGDNALLGIDGGSDVNGNGHVDNVQPGGAAYGFEEFVTSKSPLWGGGTGLYRQTIDATRLSEGQHFIEVRAFRHREPNTGPAIYSSFTKSIYVDRLDPVSAIDSFNPIVTGVNENRRLQVRSTDLTADNVHVFFDLPAALTSNQVIAMVGGGSQSTRIDRDLFTKDATNLTSGNHVVTVVTYERTGNVNVQRFPGFATSTIFGAGVGDVNFDGAYSTADISAFSTLLASSNGQFNAAADLNGDGLINNSDLVLLGSRLTVVAAPIETVQAYDQLLADRLGIRLGNFVWNDVNRNGIQEAGEPGLAGVTVNVYRGDGAFVAATQSAADGRYGFSSLAAGDYQLEFLPAARYRRSPANLGGDDRLDSDADGLTGRTATFTLATGVNLVGWDGGVFDPEPTVDVVDVAPDPRTAGVSSVQIVFSEAVSGFGVDDLRLSRDGGPNLLGAAQSLSTSDNVAFSLSNLDVVTSSPGVYTLSLIAAGAGILDQFGQALLVGAGDSFTVGAVVQGRLVFYNQSKFDGNDATTNASDDAAIATDKVALLPGGSASFANYTSFNRGLNGIMVDIAGLPAGAVLNASDFEFKVGNSDTPSAWAALAAAPTVSVRPAPGASGTSRVTLVWPSGAAIKQWLQVTVKANGNTGLIAPDVFYFGNAVGESGNVAGDYSVSITDELLARNNPVSVNPGTTVVNRFDYNRDGTVSVVDQLLARNNITTAATKLRQITAPVVLQGIGLSAQALAALHVAQSMISSGQVGNSKLSISAFSSAAEIGAGGLRQRGRIPAPEELREEHEVPGRRSTLPRTRSIECPLDDELLELLALHLR